jgi:hypothetical protein
VKVDDACTCEALSGICVEPVDYAFGPDPVSLHRLDQPSLGVVLPGAPVPVPFGLATCDDPASTPVCACAAAPECG